MTTKVDGMAMIIPLFEQAAKREAGEAVSEAEIDAVFAQWVVPVTDSDAPTAVRRQHNASLRLRFMQVFAHLRTRRRRA